MHRLSRNKPWTFCEIHPDAVIEFVPNNNAMNPEHGHVSKPRGKGAEIAFPGNHQCWMAKRTDTSQDILARFQIYASMHPEQVRERAFNVAEGAMVAWVDVCPGTCSYLGLKGVGP